MSTSAPDDESVCCIGEEYDLAVEHSLVGTTIEFYDFYIYATAAVAVFLCCSPSLAKDATTELGFLLRPSASLFIACPRFCNLGHFRQEIGRRHLAGALLTEAARKTYKDTDNFLVTVGR